MIAVNLRITYEVNQWAGGGYFSASIAYGPERESVPREILPIIGRGSSESGAADNFVEKCKTEKGIEVEIKSVTRPERRG